MTTATQLVLPDLNIDEEFRRIVDELTRRGFLAGGAGTAALLGLAACGSDGHPSAAASAGPWTFTDALGRKVTAPRRPVRIAALSDQLAADLWSAGVDVIACTRSPGTVSYLTKVGVSAAQLNAITALTASDGVNLEALAAAKPDLIVQGGGDGQLFAFNGQADIAKIAPIAGLDTYTQSVPTVISSVDRLASALGHSPRVYAAAERRYQAAAASLRRALAAKPGLRVMWCHADDKALYQDVASKYSYEMLCVQLGMHIASGHGNVYSQTVSWENVPTLPADLVIYYGTATAPANPAWQAMPAVKAGQVLVMNSGYPLDLYTYGNYAAVLSQLTTAVENARPGIGPR